MVGEVRKKSQTSWALLLLLYAQSPRRYNKAIFRNSSQEFFLENLTARESFCLSEFSQIFQGYAKQDIFAWLNVAVFVEISDKEDVKLKTFVFIGKFGAIG